MCGIIGVWDYRKETDIRRTVNDALKKISHRGPDAEGNWYDETSGLCFGHKRLAIQDLSSKGHQPMQSASGRYVISYNGEIYNFKKIRNELYRLNHSFKGGSDTEVMLASFEEWGIKKAIDNFSGMFAFSVYDKQRKELWLARDRLGEKPLYYSFYNNKLYFSSELSGILTSIDAQLELDKYEIDNYFHFGYFSPTGTPFQCIKKLAPASYVTISLEEIKNIEDINYVSDKISVYWTSRLNSSDEYIDDKEIDLFTDEFEQLLIKVLSEQTIADVGLGVFLSGGIDSTLVATILQRHQEQSAKTFTVRFDHPTYDESVYAKNLSSHLGTEHFELELTESSCLDSTMKIISSLDEPFGDASYLPTYLICKEAKKYVTVCLSGDGGDELFAGYNRYHWGNRISNFNSALPFRVRNLLGRIIKSISTQSIDSAFLYLDRLIKNPGKSEKDYGRKFHKLAEALQCHNNSDLYECLLSFWKISPMHKRPPGNFELLNGTSSFISSAMKCDQDFYLPCDNLFKVDRASMANSLEVRVPLLDYRVVEFVNNLPENAKWNKNQSKRLMKRLLYKYVPENLMDRPKMGFSVPIADWLRKELRSPFEKYFTDKELLVSRNLDYSLVNKIWGQHQSRNYDHANELWTLITYMNWVDNYQEYIITNQGSSG